ncbi:MAG: hypothetical protein EPO32_03730 [Anaerolineae bacterium]|nr:MAG: hypothetical protein EPO32_03730 [Anaerolineae bacterium]
MPTRKAPTPKLEGLRKRDPQPWFPTDTTFKVCAKHKRQYFKDYEDALLGTEDECIICHPPENDAPGG